MQISRRNAIKIMMSGAGAALVYSVPGLGVIGESKAFALPRGAEPYRLKRLYHGVAYYPELWPENDIDRDIEVMQGLGINVARTGEFIKAI